VVYDILIHSVELMALLLIVLMAIRIRKHYLKFLLFQARKPEPPIKAKPAPDVILPEKQTTTVVDDYIDGFFDR